MKEISTSLSTFWEFATVYFKKHLYFWLIAFGVACFNLAMLNIILLIVPIMFYGVIWLRRNVEFGWTSQKIRNLLLYKQLSKSDMTPLEHEIIQRYFGKHQRKQIILSLDKKKKVSHQIYLLDFIMICLMLTALPLTFPLINPPTLSNSQTVKVTGEVIAIEYIFANSSWLGVEPLYPRMTRVYFLNHSITLKGNIKLELGVNYTITFDKNSQKCVSIQK